jgi:predicted ATP-grasp superfamily ATP-dependent carboligase
VNWSKSPLLLVGLSVRALAQSAQRAGIPVVGIDLFGDKDARAACLAHYEVAGNTVNGQWSFDRAALIRQVARAVRRHGCRHWVAGSGFEVQSELLSSLHPKLKLLGNSEAQVARLKDPKKLATCFKKAGLGFPKTRCTPPHKTRGWLYKPVGGSGGYGIQNAMEASPENNQQSYWQKQIAGEPGSVLFLANGKNARMIGINHQWLAPTPAHPWRYGGAVGQQTLPLNLLAALKKSVKKLVRREALLGLNGVDFLWDGQNLTALEINPRIPATFELYDQDFKKGLMKAHIRACLGKLPHKKEGVSQKVRAYAVVHIANSVQTSAKWPLTGACRDLPRQPGPLIQGQPLCTLHTEGPTTTAAIRLLQMELNRLEQLFKGDRSC